MTLRLLLPLLAWVGGALGLRAAPEPPAFRHGHAALAEVLKAHVRDGRVDYAALQAEPNRLLSYLDQVAAIPASEFTRWTSEERLALWINLYNAQTLHLIVEHYPVRSIRQIGLLPGSAWKRPIVRLGGRVLSLDDLEHGIIRKQAGEPRVHFALVCAARGCPPLRDEPYLPGRLDEQLADQARRFLADTAKNRFDPAANILWLSPIFDWFAEDFTSGGTSLLQYLTPFLPQATRTRIASVGKPEIRFTDYDWNLNDREPGSAPANPAP